MAIADSTTGFRSAASVLSLEVARISMSVFSFAIVSESYSTLDCVNPSSISNEDGKDDVMGLIVVSSTELDSMIQCGEGLWRGETSRIAGRPVPTWEAGGALTPNPKSSVFPSAVGGHASVKGQGQS